MLSLSNETFGYSPSHIALQNTLAPFLVQFATEVTSPLGADGGGGGDVHVAPSGRRDVLSQNPHLHHRFAQSAKHLTHLFIEQNPPSYDDERHVFMNVVFGMPKIDPLVRALQDPVTIEYMTLSHQRMLDHTFAHLSVDTEAMLARCPWFRLELSSQRPMCIDRYHLATSAAVPLWDTQHYPKTRAFERNLHHYNVPATLLRRILRTEIATQDTTIIVAAVHEICRWQEYRRDPLERVPEGWPERPDNVGSESLWHLVDLDHALAPFIHTARYLFPVRTHTAAVHAAARDIRAVLGRTEFVFHTYSIPPPCADYLLHINRIETDGLDDLAWYDAMHATYQLYTTVLWRLVKLHRFQAALVYAMRHASRNQYETRYHYDSLKLIEYRVQLVIDTHLSIYAYACGDNCWSDAEWLRGPVPLQNERDGSGDLPDVGRHSPILRFYPHCRHVHACESELPDASSVIGLGNLRYDINVKPALPTQRQAFIHMFACKVMTHRCAIRNFKKILLRYINGCKTQPKRPEFQGYRAIKEYVLLLVRCGLLGNWKMCDVRATFARRIEIEYAFLDLVVPLPTGEHLTVDEIERHGRLDEMDGLTGEHPTRITYRSADLNMWAQSDSITRWITKNYKLCFYIFKEAYVHAFEKRSAIDIVMHRNMRWGRYKHLMRACMDRVRYTYNTNGGSAMPASVHREWLEPLDASPARIHRYRQLCTHVESVISTFHELGKRCFIKLYKGAFQRVLLKHMNTALAGVASGKFTPETLRYLRRNDMMFFRVTLDGDNEAAAADGDGARPVLDDDDDDDDEDDEDEEEGGAMFLGGGARDEEAGDMVVDDDDGGGSTATSLQDRNTVAIVKHIREISQHTPDVDLDLMDMVARDAMRRRQGMWRVELHWLVELFGVSLTTLDILKRIYTVYEAYDMPDHPIIKRVAQVYAHSPRDFHVVRLYLAMLLWHGNQLFVPLPKDVRWRQIAALRRRWAIPLNRDLSQDIGWAFFSPTNGRWYSAEVPRQPVKVDWRIGMERYRRDLGFSTPALDEVRMTATMTHLQQLEHDSEMATSVNMNRVAYDDRNGAMYAKNRGESSMQRLQASEVVGLATDSHQTLLSLFGNDGDAGGGGIAGAAEMDPERIVGGIAVAAGINVDHERDLGGIAAGEEGAMDSDDDDDDDDDEPVQDGTVGGDRPLRTLFQTPHVTVLVSEDAERRQFGRLTTEARARYRRTIGPPYLCTGRGSSKALVATDMVGVLKYRNDRLYTLCVVCGCVMHFTSARMSNAGPNCGAHDPHAFFRANRKFLRTHGTPLPAAPHTTFRQRILKADGNLGPSSSQTESAAAAPAAEETPDNGAGRATAVAPPHNDCIFCQTLGSQPGNNGGRRRRFRFLMVDAQTGHARSETHHVCRRHYRPGRYLLDGAMLEEDRPARFSVHGPSAETRFAPVLDMIVRRSLDGARRRQSRHRYRKR